MPDHLHVLAVGENGSQLSSFTKLFKQLSGYAGRKITGKPIWQISYYDHVLRAEEEVGKVARYILNNPVRAGLVDSPEEYPFLGPRPLPL